MGTKLGTYEVGIRAALGHPPQDVLSDEELNGAINDAYFELVRLFKHRRLKRDRAITTTSGTQEYALPSDYFFMRLVKDETNVDLLDYRTMNWIQAREDHTSTGLPEYWTTEDQNIFLYPNPGGTYTIRLWYVARPSRLTNPTDQSVFEDEWDEVLKRGAEARAFYIMEEYDRQVHALNLQRTILNKMVEVEDLEAQASPQIIGPLGTDRSPQA